MSGERDLFLGAVVDAGLGKRSDTRLHYDPSDRTTQA
jgi:hypothetical protein